MPNFNIFENLNGIHIDVWIIFSFFNKKFEEFMTFSFILRKIKSRIYQTCNYICKDSVRQKNLNKIKMNNESQKSNLWFSIKIHPVNDSGKTE